jgi:choline dehydrogenase-like flavoprotein
MQNKPKVIIIGSGASGSAAAWNLSKSSFNIICFEQGPDLEKKSYSSNSLKWEILKKKFFNPNPNIRKMKNDFSIDDKNSPISIANFNAVGGSTILYNCHFPRFHISDFKTKSLDNIGEDWPITYKDLKKYYDQNDKIMNVCGVGGDPAYPDIKNLNKNIPIGKVGIKIAKGFNSLKWHWWPSYSAYLHNSKKKLNFERSTAKNTYLSKAIKNGVKIKKNCQVIEIIVDPKNDAKGVFYKNSRGKKIFESADIILLAAGGIGTPRILLNSKSKKFPEGLANSSKLVGKNLMLHPLGYVEGVFKDFLATNVGPEGCCLASHEFYETDSERDFKRGYSMQVLRGAGPLDTATRLSKLKKITFGNKFHSNFFKYFGKTVGIAVICEDLADKKNNVVLDHNNLDQNKMPGVKINYSLDKNSKNMMRHGLNNAKKILVKSGAKFLHGYGPVRNTGWHIMGTTKMGINPKKSVVNQFGQCHDVSNLFIVDSSIFVTSSGVNCMSTIQALTLKITENIKSNLKSLLKE